MHLLRVAHNAGVQGLDAAEAVAGLCIDEEEEGEGEEEVGEGSTAGVASPGASQASAVGGSATSKRAPSRRTSQVGGLSARRISVAGSSGGLKPQQGPHTIHQWPVVFDGDQGDGRSSDSIDRPARAYACFFSLSLLIAALIMAVSFCAGTVSLRCARGAARVLRCGSRFHRLAAAAMPMACACS